MKATGSLQVVARELLGAAGLQRDPVAASTAIARNALVSQVVARLPGDCAIASESWQEQRKCREPSRGRSRSGKG